MGVLYEHWRTDLNECFYVGVSWENPDTRPYEMDGRNEKHTQFQEEIKANGAKIEVRLVECDHLTKPELGDFETLQIVYWKDLIGDRLANKALGGFGLHMDWNDPDFYNKFCQIQKQAQGTLERRIANSVAQKEAQNRPEVAIKKSQKRKAYLAKPGILDNMRLWAKESHERKTPEQLEIERINKSIAQKEAQNKPSVKQKRKDTRNARSSEQIASETQNRSRATKTVHENRSEEKTREVVSKISASVTIAHARSSTKARHKAACKEAQNKPEVVAASSLRQREFQATRTPEARTNSAYKAWETRRRNKELKLAALAAAEVMEK
jgi:hypothetical protein